MAVDITFDVSTCKAIGSGSFSKVYESQLKTGEKVAIKLIRPSKEHEQKNMIINEAVLLTFV